MRLSKLKKQIDTIEEVCELFVHVDEEESKKIQDDIVLKIKVFENIVKECKKEIQLSDLEHKVHVLKSRYGIEIDEESGRLDASLDSYMSKQIDAKFIEADEKQIDTLKSLISYIDDIVEKLAVEYKTLLYVNKKWYKFKGFKLKKYAKFLTKLMSLKEKLQTKLEDDSKKISVLIIDNFYRLYIFFSFLISLFVLKKSEMLLIEIASRLDKYIEVIETSFRNRSLHHDDMVHHYTIYELKELREQIFTELAPQ